ncbi:hypothetical protein EGK14_11650 [Erwinia sp. 198]|nr:hypothetical protein EGK14_11650 [Erwinia sp. 198]
MRFFSAAKGTNKAHLSEAMCNDGAQDYKNERPGKPEMRKSKMFIYLWVKGWKQDSPRKQAGSRVRNYPFPYFMKN